MFGAQLAVLLPLLNLIFLELYVLALFIFSCTIPLSSLQFLSSPAASLRDRSTVYIEYFFRKMKSGVR